MRDDKHPINGQPYDIQEPLKRLLLALGFPDYEAVRKVEITPAEVIVLVVQRNEDGVKQLAPDYGVLLSEHKLAVRT